jgi:hypothetical protein
VSLRWPSCTVLLLAIPVLAQQSASPAVPERSTSQAAQKPESPITEIKVECLPASRASELIDKHGCVAGRVFRVTHPKNGSTHLSLCPPKRDCSFHAVVFEHDHANVGDLTYLHGKFVAFVGDITSYRGKPEIVIKDRRQIHVTAGNPPSEFDAAQPTPLTTGQPTSGKRGRAW